MTGSIDLNRIQIFNEVVLAGSFSKAAAKLRQPKSRMSRNISALERELGVQLIYRTTRQFQLTPAGRELFAKVQPLMNELANTLESVTTGSVEVTGPLRISVPEDMGVELMGGLCHEFLKLYPKVRIDLHVSNQFVDLVKEGFDVAVRIGRLRDSSLIQKKVGEIQMVMVISPTVRAKWGDLRSVTDLENKPYLSFLLSDPKKHSLKISNGRETRTLKLKPTFMCNNLFAVRAMAVHGEGVTLLPTFLAREPIREGTLIPLFKEWTTEGVPVHAVMPHQKEIPLRVKKWNEFLAQKLAAIL